MQPLTAGTPAKPRCKAVRRNSGGKPCGNPPMAGAVVCRMHGGSARQVKRKAAQRLADLIDPNRVLRETAALAYSDVTELTDASGNIKPLREWPPVLRAAVASVEVVKRNVDSGDGHTDDVIKIRLWDKPRALEMLMRHLGMLNEKLAVNVHMPGVEIILQRLAAGRERLLDDGNGSRS